MALAVVSRYPSAPVTLAAPCGRGFPDRSAAKWRHRHHARTLAIRRCSNLALCKSGCLATHWPAAANRYRIPCHLRLRSLRNVRYCGCIDPLRSTSPPWRGHCSGVQAWTLRSVGSSGGAERFSKSPCPGFRPDFYLLWACSWKIDWLVDEICAQLLDLLPQLLNQSVLSLQLCQLFTSHRPKLLNG
jgi:hypothetical protein